MAPGTPRALRRRREGGRPRIRAGLARDHREGRELRPKAPRAVALGLLAAALALAGCLGGDGDGNAEEGEGGPPTPSEAYSEIVAEVAEEGSSPELALRAFALAFGPIPGAEPPETAEGPPLPSGTGAIQLVMPHWEELSAEQQEAIEERLIPPGLRAVEEQGGTPDSGGGVSGVGPRADGASARLTAHEPGTTRLVQETYEALRDDQLEARARRIAASFAGRMGVSPPSDHFVGLPGDAAAQWAVSGSDAWTVSVHVVPGEVRFDFQVPDGSPQDACLTLINPEIKTGGTDANFESLLAHETFHCLQNEIHGPRWNSDKSPWVSEGLAAWAGEVWATEQGAVGPRYANQEPGAWWPGYFGVDRELFAQDYDAIGFWAQLHAVASGARFWQRVPEILRVSRPPGGRALSAALRGQEDAFLPLWAPQMARQPEFGEGWNLADFGTTFKVPATERLEPEVIDITRNLVDPIGKFRAEIDPRSPRLFEFRMPRVDTIDSVEMTVEGFGEMLWQATPHENAVIRGSASRTIRLGEGGDQSTSEGEECENQEEEEPEEEEDTARRGDVLIVALASTTDSHIEFSAQGEEGEEEEEECEEEEEEEDEDEEDEEAAPPPDRRGGGGGGCPSAAGQVYGPNTEVGRCFCRTNNPYCIYNPDLGK